VVFSEFFLGKTYQLCQYLLDPKNFIFLKKQYDTLKNKTIDFFNTFIENYKQVESPPIINTEPSDPCVGVDSIPKPGYTFLDNFDPSTFYVAGGSSRLIRLIRATALENYLSRLIVRMVGNKLSFRLVSGFLVTCIYLIKNLGVFTGFIIIGEVLKLMNEPNDIVKNIRSFLTNPERNPTISPIAQEVLLN
jgi:hypothetical protein